jgi:hypothetical protein
MADIQFGEERKRVLTGIGRFGIMTANPEKAWYGGDRGSSGDL